MEPRFKKARKNDDYEQEEEQQEDYEQEEEQQQEEVEEEEQQQEVEEEEQQQQEVEEEEEVEEENTYDIQEDDEEDQEETWSCDYCTLINQYSENLCEACGHRRKLEPRTGGAFTSNSTWGLKWSTSTSPTDMNTTTSKQKGGKRKRR